MSYADASQPTKFQSVRICRTIEEIQQEMERRGIKMTCPAVNQAIRRAERKIRRAVLCQDKDDADIHGIIAHPAR